jgi:hypothetical protein
MMRKLLHNPIKQTSPRRGSTLVIVLALLSLLSFLGIVFYSFATSERRAAEYFSEAAKAQVDEPANVWDHMLKQVIVGPGSKASEKRSILWSNTQRHSMVQNLVGPDIHPHTGGGVGVRYNGSGLPVLSNAPAGADWMNFVDSPAARVGSERRAFQPPAPDVDYTYPDINNLFLAYKGWAIRDNGGGTTPRYERVPVIIPSFFRPQYMKTSGGNGPAGTTVPTNQFWAYADDGSGNPTDVITPGNRSTLNLGTFQGRSFRPNPNHIVGFQNDGTTPILRYLTDAEAAGFGIASGGFPFVPENHLTLPNNFAVRGEMGVWTGSEPGVYELDADNDGDDIKEGIWLDLNFPLQEHVDAGGNTRQYVVLHSVTVYDLDGLIDANVVGNLAGLDRSGTLSTIATSGLMATDMLSRSDLGLGPNEINPLWALRRDNRDITSGLGAYRLQPGIVALNDQFVGHFGRRPTTSVEQANMEWMWLLTGRGEFAAGGGNLTDLFAGRWGEQERLFNAISTGLVSDLPRPGRTGNAQQTTSTGVRFGGALSAPGRKGYDDNQDRFEGEIGSGIPRVRPFGTPMDFAGTGRTHLGAIGSYADGTGRFAFPAGSDPRLPQLYHDTTSTGPERWLGFIEYGFTRGSSLINPRYIFGQNGIFNNGTGDDLIANMFLDALLEDPLETVFDIDFAQRPWDQIFSPQDALALHLTSADIANSPDGIGTHLSDLAPFAFGTANPPFSFNENISPGVRSRFTALSNSLRRFMIRSPFGSDGRPGDAGVDDDGDGTIDELDEIYPPNTYRDNDDPSRAWEFNADSDGADNDDDGFGDGDGRFEFPPQFGAATPYGPIDPFRPQVRRMLNVEAGENRALIGQLPLSINHILDVDRVTTTPAEGTSRFLYYMQRSGLRLRPLTEHPAATEDPAILNVTVIPTYSTSNPVTYPPTDFAEREFWARRDRQKMARDIYVLLYTIGGNSQDTTAAPVRPMDYTGVNNPNAAEGSSLYTHEQLRRMAQFAVNMIDAMDTDDIPTKFEYDKNFGDGWNLDDDPYAMPAESVPLTLTGNPATYFAGTANGMYPEDSNERGVVYGVEAQQLAFTEVIGMDSANFTPGGYMDHAATLHDDENGDRRFLQVELTNVRPTVVELATSVTASTDVDRAIWQLARYDRTAIAAPQRNVPTETLTFMNGNGNVDGGDRFTIAMAALNGSPADSNPTGWGTADIYVDSSAGGTFDLIAPDVAAPGVTAGSPVTPRCDLDVVYGTYPQQRWLGSGNSTEPGRFLDNMMAYQGNDGYAIPARASEVGFDLVLRRRLNPNMPRLPIADNPWIEVDRIRVTFSDLFDLSGATPSLQLNQVRSWERREALDAAFVSSGFGSYQRYPNSQAGDPSPLAYRFNTIGSELNSATGRKTRKFFELWQPHFDRDFASSAELFHVPVVGPKLLTNRLNRMRMAPYQHVHDDPGTPVGDSDVSWVSSAAGMFLNANFPNILDGAYDDDNNVATAEVPVSAALEAARDNRWYRLFQFVEVPSRVHRMLGNYVTLDRVPGKINLNTIRHREVYAGLIDSPFYADVPRLLDTSVGGGGPNNAEDGPFLTSQSTMQATAGDMWHDLIRDRDGIPVSSYDPTAGTPGSRNFWIPGTPNARPFRSPGYRSTSLTDDNGLEDTILRRQFGDRFDNHASLGAAAAGSNDPTTNRQLLEVGNETFHQNPNSVAGGAGSATVQRHQILSKVMNNTTTVSNTFIVYSTAAYFEAVEDPVTGLVRVGGRYDLDGDGDPANDQQRAVFLLDRTEAFKAYDAGSGDFNWERIVKHRATIE